MLPALQAVWPVPSSRHSRTDDEEGGESDDEAATDSSQSDERAIYDTAAAFAKPGCHGPRSRDDCGMNSECLAGC